MNTPKRPTDQDRSAAPAEGSARDLYGLIDSIEIAMLTTRLGDGSLVSRPMATQARRPGVDVWFVTSTETHKVEEIEREPHVNLAYYKDGEWVSVSGRARVNREREVIRALYKPDWRAWFGDEGGARDGGPDDPRLVLIEVKAESATWFEQKQPRVVVMLKVLKAAVTGDPPDLGEEKHLTGSALRNCAR